mgnify:CR=1 FL=1
MWGKSKLFIFLCCSVCTSCIAQNEISKELKVKEIKSDKDVTLVQVSKLLEEQAELHTIDLVNWHEFQYLPEVTFRIAHSNNQIWLKYYVKEKSILAEVNETNGGVANDSCVEFFFDPMADGNYYNFEFSCIGVTHLAYGPDRNDRVFIAPEIIEKEVKVSSSLGDLPFSEQTGDYAWEMTIIIPGSSLTHNKELQLKGRSARANFYKCGNKTAESHYVSWNPVLTKRPDFHRPEYFGHLIFE